MVDTHAHLNSKVFDKDYAQVIERSFRNGIKFIINAGTGLETSKKAIEIANQFENVYPVESRKAGIRHCGGLFNRVYAAIGLHPVDIGKEKFDFEVYKKLAQDKKVVAIGETGLDYFHITDPSLIIHQREVFLQHLKLAQELNLPLILHCRGAKNEPLKPYYEMLEILAKPPHLIGTGAFSAKIDKSVPIRCGGKGVIHCFIATSEIAKKFIDLGFAIGFTGVITFAKQLEEVVREIPLTNILTETDCPYLAPEPYRGKRNEPSYVKFVIEKIARIKNLSISEVSEQTTQNATELFKLC